MNKWQHKDLWLKRMDGFAVEVSRHSVPISSFDEGECGTNRWCVYAYIYPPHAYFKSFDGNDMFQPAANAMPLHCGPSLFRRNVDNDGAVTSIQVGADYDHLYDNAYSFYETPEDASSVFHDADRLVSWLDAAAKEEAA